MYNVESRTHHDQIFRPVSPSLENTGVVYQEMFDGAHHQQNAGSGVGFYPLEELRETSLQELLELPDDAFFGTLNISNLEEASSEGGFSTIVPNVNNACLPAPVSPPSSRGGTTISDILQIALDIANDNPIPVTPDAPKMRLVGGEHFGLDTASSANSGGSNKRVHEDDCEVDDDDFCLTEEDLEGTGDESSISTNIGDIKDLIEPKRGDGQFKRRKTGGRRYRVYQDGQWAQMFETLCEYQRKFGHCIVPHNHGENHALANWVKRQRYQYKLRSDGSPKSTMSLERIAALESIGFVWNSQELIWMERLQELKAFKDVFNHCNVPSNYLSNKSLANWIKGQRKYILLCKTESCSCVRRHKV
jgi:Helicase associated domain